MGTDTWTSANGSTASISFSGTALTSPVPDLKLTFLKALKSVCTEQSGPPPPAPQSSYSVDGGAPIAFVAVQSVDIQYKQNFFQSDLLPSDIHTLLIENTAHGGDFYVDYVSIISLGDTTPTSPMGTSPAATTIVTHSSTKSSSVGPIVGGLLGGLVFIALCLAGVFY